MLLRFLQLRSKVFWIIMLSPLFLMKGYSQKLIDVESFKRGISKPNVQLIDVRTISEYQNGHLKNAKVIDWYIQEYFSQKVALLDKTKPVYVYCEAGVRSGKASKMLTEKGFEVYDLKGGMKAWRLGK